MKYRLHFLLPGLAVAAWLIFMACGCDLSSGSRPQAIKGVINLSSWDFARNGAIDLDGEYEFYWQQLVPPEEFSRGELAPRHFMPVPAAWKGHTVDGVNLPGAGYATYRLTVLLNPGAPRLALKFLDMGTAFTVFANGRKILAVGAVGQTAATSAPHYAPQIIEVPSDSGRLELVFHVSNFHHNRGGAWEEIRLGPREQLTKIRDRSLTLDLILFGSIFSLGLYHLTLSSLRPNDRAPLLFGFYCLLVAVRLLTPMERALLRFFPEMSWELFVKIEYLSFYPAVAVFALFIYRLFSQDFHKLVLGIIVVLSISAALIVVLTPARIFTQTLFVFQIFTILALLYGLGLLVVCARRQREGAALLLVGLLFLAAAVINDILDANEIIQSGHLVHFGLFIFIFSHAFILSSRYATAFKTIARQRGELAVAEARYRTLYDHNPSMYFTLNAQGNILSVNHFGAKQLGYTVQALEGSSVLNVFHPADHPEVLRQLQKCLQNPAEVYHWEIRKRRQDGSTLWVKEHARAVKDFQGAAVVFIVCEDITEHKAAEQALRESEKLAATGRMAARIAHEINNPLAAIKTAFHLIKHGLPPEHRYHHYLEKIDNDVKRIAAIVYRMLELYSPEQHIPNTFHLEAFLQGILETMRLTAARQQIEIKLHNTAPDGTVRLPENRLRDVLSMLIQNAIEVSPFGGKIFINAAIEQQKLRISVIDQGGGIATEDRVHVFEPFYTTKDHPANGSGLGLGLTICKSLVEAMNGEIEFDSLPGRGTEFRVILPLMQHSEPEAKDAEAKEKSD